jgi:uncharacterized protein (DUF1501 family)
MNPPENCTKEDQNRLWEKGFTRRRFLAGAGLAGVAALGTQLVTSRMSFTPAAAANAPASLNTLIVLFMRGAADGLRILVPNAPSLGLADLQAARPALVPANGTLVPLPNAGGWAMNGAMAPLLPYWNSNELAFVPAVSIETLSRSHFAAQQLLECGGVSTSTSGWLDRALTSIGGASTFRSVADGGLYNGMGGFLGHDVPDALAAAEQATAFAAGTPQNGAVYPSGNLSTTFQDFAKLLRAEVGLQVATADVGGWDTHTSEVSELDPNLGTLANTLAAFLQDLGPVRRSRVTIAVMTEFGRRVAQNASGGTDHGHGSVMWLLGGGLRQSGVYGAWRGLASNVLDQGDVPMVNNAYDVLGEALQMRLGLGSLSTVFPAHAYAPLGIMTTRSSHPLYVSRSKFTPVGQR